MLDSRCFFYITNDEELPAEEIVFGANGHHGTVVSWCCLAPASWATLADS